jgi:hypothetical protein
MLAIASVPSDDTAPQERRFTERRYAHGELLLAAFIAARRPLTFDDLASVLTDTGARVSDVATWLATAQDSGLISHEGYETGPLGEPIGPRRFALSADARNELRARRTQRRRYATA